MFVAPLATERWVPHFGKEIFPTPGNPSAPDLGPKTFSANSLGKKYGVDPSESLRKRKPLLRDRNKYYLPALMGKVDGRGSKRPSG